MDLDLLQDIDILAEREPLPLPGRLLHNSPGRPLTDDSDRVNDSNDHYTRADPFPYSSNQNQTGAVISKIEDIFEAMADCILGERNELVIQLKSRSRPGTKALNSVSGVIGSLQDTRFRNITFPSRSPQEAWKFTALFRILELSHEALVNGIVTTKRDMYYRDPELFLKQAVVDRFVDDIAYTFGVERHALNVVAAAKGLVAGAFYVKRKDGSTADFSAELEGMLVPDTKNIEGIELEEIRWVLVIEKEATFRTLATSQYWKESRAGKGIIITAKGYPDIQTRILLRMLSTQKPSIPIFALVDFDPDGIGIMSTYKHGSMALAHESANLAVPSISWLGVRSNDIPLSGPGLLKLTPRDRRIATRILEKELFLEGGREAEQRRELQTMLFLNVKAEIQILGNGEALTAWLDSKLRISGI